MKLVIAAVGVFCAFTAVLLLSWSHPSSSRTFILLKKGLETAGYGRISVRQREEAYWRQLHNAMENFKAHKGELTNYDLLDNFSPFYSCNLKERIGHPLDGGKWICDRDQLLRHPGCVIFSLGSLGETSFEEAILQRAPDCDIHTYDNTLDPKVKDKVEAIPGITFHAEGIYSAAQLAQMTQNGTHLAIPIQRHEDSTAKYTTLQRAMADNGAHWLDVLKIDIEGSEWPVFGELLASNDTIPITQILIELHFPALDSFPDLFPGSRADALEKYFGGMWRHEYRAFSAELNLRGPAGDYIEYSFIKVDGSGKVVTGRSH